MKLVNIPLKDIIFKNKLNDRDIDEIKESKTFIELISSIKQVGLLQPICVELKDGKYELLFGKRRYLAFETLIEIEGKKFLDIPAIVTDEEEDVPQALKILHENRFREGISKNTYLESSLYLLPKFINKENEYSLKNGIEYIENYITVKKNKEDAGIPPLELIEFTNSVEDFLEFTKCDISDLEKYSKLNEKNIIFQELYFNSKIYFSSISDLEYIEENNVEDFNKCVEELRELSFKKDSKDCISKYIKKEKKHKKDEAISYIKNRLRSIDRNLQKYENFDESSLDEVQKLFNQIEKVFKKSIKKDEK